MAPPRSSITIDVPYVKTLHKQPYPAISPLRPELRQAGRTVLVLGGSAGIGFAIARAFIQAKAAQVILTGRRQDVLADSVARLKAEAEANGSGTFIRGVVSNMADLQDSEKLWSDFKRDGLFIDVLVLNVATLGEGKPILQASLESTWVSFETNVRALLDYTKRFDAQGKKQKYLINISSSAIHNHATESALFPTYALTKNSGTLLVQQIAKDTDPNEMQIVSLHPGTILTEAGRNAGMDESTLDWDNENLPGQFAVWCASDEARFLHGRFVPAWWDVDELKAGEVSRRIESGSEYHFLRIGVVGL